MGSGATRTVLIAPATDAGADITRAGTTCSVPPGGRLSSSLARTAASAWAAVPVADTTNGSWYSTVRPEPRSQPPTARCCAAVAPKSCRTRAGVR